MEELKKFVVKQFCLEKRKILPHKPFTDSISCFFMSRKNIFFNNFKIDNGLAIDIILVGMESENFKREESILHSHRIKLNSTPSDHEKEKFLKGNLALFRLEANDVGRVCPVFISHSIMVLILG